MFKAQRKSNEAFGDFVARVGFESVRDYAAAYVPADVAAGMPQVPVAEEVLVEIERRAADKGMSAAHFVNEVLQQYLEGGNGSSGNGSKA